jgi:omega-6 fatty acid desaturase (delta-12 desaturase)
VWRQTHNYHHAHTAQIVGSHVGSYAMLTPDLYARATPRQRLLYRITRHPLTVALGYVTIFLYGMCLASFLRNRRKNWDSLVALVLHAALSATLLALAPRAYVFALLLPMSVACAVGAYLFYAQHNFAEMHVQPRESWEYTRAALESSSYMPMGRVMRYFTGNIGYHHVHHLNPGIPFYRLPEAMAAIPALQNPGITTLTLRDVVASFRLKLWDPASGRMVGYPESAGSVVERVTAQ